MHFFLPRDLRLFEGETLIIEACGGFFSGNKERSSSDQEQQVVFLTIPFP
jgi:hypothetical protein